MFPSPTDLSYFLEVAHTLNISRAAERLGISQPTLSIAIQRLEGSLGVPLLLRTKAGVRPTHAGRKLAAQAQHLMREWDRIRGDALKDESELRGRYTIGCHPSVAMGVLPKFLPGMMIQHPHLEVQLAHDLSRKITEDVISFKVDFGIVVNPWEHPDLIIKPLYRDEVTLWTSPQETALQKMGSGEAVLICDPDLAQSQSLLRQFAKKGIAFRRVVPSGNLEVVTALVAAGQGIGIIPERVATRQKHLRLRPVKGAPKFTDRHCLVYRADVQKSAASRTIARLIETALKE